MLFGLLCGAVDVKKPQAIGPGFLLGYCWIRSAYSRLVRSLGTCRTISPCIVAANGDCSGADGSWLPFCGAVGGVLPPQAWGLTRACTHK